MPRNTPHRSGFSLVEMLIVVAIIAAVASLGLPTVQASREAARSTTCANNLKQVGIGSLYIVNNKRTVPLQPGPWCAIGDPEFCEQFTGVKRKTPDSYFLVFEDMAYNSPFDGVILVEPLAQGGSNMPRRWPMSSARLPLARSLGGRT